MILIILTIKVPVDGLAPILKTYIFKARVNCGMILITK